MGEAARAARLAALRRRQRQPLLDPVQRGRGLPQPITWTFLAPGATTGTT